MSADNFYLVRPVGGEFVATLEFASDQTAAPGLFPSHPSPVDAPSAVRFGTLAEAVAYASSQDSEYGVEIWDGSECCADDTALSRLLAAASRLADKVELTGMGDTGRGFSLDLGSVSLTVDGPDADLFVDWVLATLPSALLGVVRPAVTPA